MGENKKKIFNGKSPFFVNILAYIIKATLGALLPLFMYKHASNVLEVNMIGMAEYAKSIVSYFSLIAAAGISTFAIREGALIRDDRNKLESFVSRIYGINILTMVFAYVLLVLFCFFSKQNKQCIELIIIYSMSMLLTTIGLEWIYNIYERFVYMTIRSIAFNFIALLGMLVFVRDEKDVYKYMLLVVFASYGYNILNRCLMPKLIKVGCKLDRQCFIYIKSICILFFNNIATTIYVSADSTMVGYISGTYRLGLYSASVSVYNAFKRIVSAIISVLLPYLTHEYGRNYDGYLKEQKFFLKTSILVAVPVSVGMAVFSKELILLLSSESYIQAYRSLDILALSFLFSIIGSMVNATILLPKKMEKYIVVSTSVGAILNICLNIVIIPKYAEIGAAATTALSELVVIGMQCFFGRDILKKLNISIWNDIVPCVLSIIIVVVSNEIYAVIIKNRYIKMTAVMVSSIILYIIILLIFKNECFYEVRLGIKKLISRKKNH